MVVAVIVMLMVSYSFLKSKYGLLFFFLTIVVLQAPLLKDIVLNFRVLSSEEQKRINPNFKYSWAFFLVYLFIYYTVRTCVC